MIFIACYESINKKYIKNVYGEFTTYGSYNRSFYSAYLHEVNEEIKNDNIIMMENIRINMINHKKK